jgi:hypothetical protein
MSKTPESENEQATASGLNDPPCYPAFKHPISEVDFKMALENLEKAKKLLIAGRYEFAASYAACASEWSLILARQERSILE